MAEERTNDVTPVDAEQVGHADTTTGPVPINPVENGQDATHEQTKTDDTKVHKVPKQQKEAPQWLQALKGFFQTLFVTPWALLQKILMRIAGGKKMVEESEKQLLDEQQANKVREAQEKNAKFLEREINDLLKMREGDSEYMQDGLTISHVSIGPNITGDAEIMHTITIQCMNGEDKAGEYQLHLDQSGMLRYNAIVPPELQLMLQELIQSATLKAEDVSVGAHDDPDGPGDGIDDPVETGPIDPVLAQHKILASEVHSEHENIKVDVVRNGDDATVTVTYADGQVAQLKANYQEGCISVDGLTQNSVANAVVAQTVYQAYLPLLENTVKEATQSGTLTPEDIRGGACAAAFNAIQASSQTILAAAARPEQQAAKDGIDASIHIIPNAEDLHKSATVIEQFISYQPYIAGPSGNDRVNLHTRTLDVSSEDIFAFNGELAGQHPHVAISGELNSKVHADTITQRMMNWFTETTGYGSVSMDDKASKSAYTLDTQTHHKYAETCVVQTQQDGYQVKSEYGLSEQGLRELTGYLQRSDQPTEPSLETFSKAAAWLNANHPHESYFIINDMAFSYDRKEGALSVCRMGTDKVFTQSIGKLDDHNLHAAFETAHTELTVDEATLDAPANDEHEDHTA